MPAAAPAGIVCVCTNPAHPHLALRSSRGRHRRFQSDSGGRSRDGAQILRKEIRILQFGRHRSGVKYRIFGQDVFVEGVPRDAPITSIRWRTTMATRRQPAMWIAPTPCTRSISSQAVLSGSTSSMRTTCLISITPFRPGIRASHPRNKSAGRHVLSA